MRNPTLSLIIATGLALTPALAQMPPSGPMPPAENRTLAHDLLRDLVAVHSVHDEGTKAAADVIVRYLKAAGFADTDMHELADPKYPRQMNVVVRLRGKGQGKAVLWLGHLDVVEAKPEDWSLPPFKLTEKDGYFYGRGTTDMKDDDAMMAAALIRLKQEHFVPARDIIAAFTADEEVGLEQDGPAWLLKTHRDLVDAGMVINTDGSSGEIDHGKRKDFTIETSQKTYVTFSLDVYNKGGHSSEPRPDNAIYQLAKALTLLSQYQFPIALTPTSRDYLRQTASFESGQKRADMLAVAAERPDLAAAKRLTGDVALNAILHSTCVATMLKAGVQENALPAHAEAIVQCRIMPGEMPEATRQTIARVLGDPEIKVSMMGFVVSAGESPMPAASRASVEKIVHGMWPGVPVIASMSAGASDSIFTRNAGLASYGISGAWEDEHDVRAHGRDERLQVDDFYSGTEFTYRLMKELAQ